MTIPRSSFDEYFQKEFTVESATWLSEGFPPFDIGSKDGMLLNELNHEHSSERWIEHIQFIYAAIMEYPDGKKAMEVIWEAKDEIKKV